MLSLLKKEIGSFLSSITGYVVIGVFLVITGLFLWIFPGEMNIPESGLSSLESLFYLSPWVFLFLVPAISMRMLSEEKKSGTIELLLTRPLSDFQIIFSKYLAIVLLILISLVPTLIYYISVYLLGNPVGNLDVGATWGSYIGLVFLACVYASIGLFASSLTDNQIISFLIGVLITFIMFIGFDYFAGMFETSTFNAAVLNLGINEHYKSISRGVVDSREIIYFISISMFFIVLSVFNLRRGQRDDSFKYFNKGWAVVLIVCLFLVNYASSKIFTRIDLTEDKRFTLAEPTKKYLTGLEDYVYIKIYLDGDLPIGFNKFKKSIEELLDEFRVYSKYIEYNFVNPYDLESAEEQNALFTELYQKGISPVDLRIRSEDGLVQKNIFPGAMIGYKNAETGVNLLSNNPGLSDEVNLNNSVQNLEYNLISVIKNITSTKIDHVAFIEGHGELDEYQVEDISRAMSNYYQIDRGRIDGQMSVLDNFKAVIIAQPQKPFSEADKLVLDQYLMKGGKILFFIDPVSASIDSLESGSTLAYIKDLNIDDLLFHYGFRINPQLLKDLHAGYLVINTALVGEPTKLESFLWYYNPWISGRQEHPITKSLNMIKTEFVSWIDTVETEAKIKRTPLLWTSDATSIVNVPAYISLGEVGRQPNKSEYNAGKQTIAMLAEGEFHSFYKDRMINEIIGYSTDIQTQGINSKILVVADGDIIENDVKHTPNGTMIGKLGYDRNTKQTFGNKDFILNALNYMTDEDGIINLRSREYKLRLLDTQKIKNRHNQIMVINICLPIFIVVLIGIIGGYVRKRKYSQ